MKKIIVIVALLLMGNIYCMDIARAISEPSGPKELSSIEQLPTELKIRIIEYVLSADNLSQALKSINVLARTSKTFAELLQDPGLKVELAKKLTLLQTSSFVQARELGRPLGVANEQWFTNYLDLLEKKLVRYKHINDSRALKGQTLFFPPKVCERVSFINA